MANLTSQLYSDLQPDDWLFRHTRFIWSQPVHLGISYRCENKPQEKQSNEMLAVAHTWTNESLVYWCMHQIVVESMPCYACMYVCIHTYVHECMHTYIHTYIHPYIIHVYVCTQPFCNLTLDILDLHQDSHHHQYPTHKYHYCQH